MQRSTTTFSGTKRIEPENKAQDLSRQGEDQSEGYGFVPLKQGRWSLLTRVCLSSSRRKAKTRGLLPSARRPLLTGDKATWWSSFLSKPGSSQQHPSPCPPPTTPYQPLLADTVIRMKRLRTPLGVMGREPQSSSTPDPTVGAVPPSMEPCLSWLEV